jgi:Mrp family chromosome partitioning ATPase
MPVADARVIAALGDATVLVLRAQSSTRRVILAARNELWKVRATRLGVVINGVPTHKAAYGYGYGYGAPYGHYGYVSYGYGEEHTRPGQSKKRSLLSKQPSESMTTADSA